MSFQPEERYWTDYLRIALPVIGLLILIALLWYWASALIGGPSGSEPTPGTTPITEVLATEAPPASPMPSPTPTAPATSTTPGVAPTATIPAATNPTVEPAPTTGTDSGTQGGNTLPECQNRPDHGVGATVVTSNDVNLRTEATSDSPSLGILTAGTQLQTTGPFVDLPDCDWWPVTDPATGQNGFIREDFLEDPSDQ
ncbi:MAG: SH3 domain-containing protein [Chloroflexota bacterium]|nr:SH3 domain-containing protein [Chloroflexota bacterium]